MKALKKIADFFNNKVQTAIENNTSASDRNRQAARILIAKIDKLRHAEIDSQLHLVKITGLAYDHQKEHEKKDRSIRALLEAGQNVPNAMYVLSVQHRNISEAMTAKAEKAKETIDKIPAAVAGLSEKLEEVRLNQEVYDLMQTSKDLGVELPEDLQASVDHTLADVENILTEISVFNSEENVANASPIDVQVYKAELAKK